MVQSASKLDTYLKENAELADGKDQRSECFTSDKCPRQRTSCSVTKLNDHVNGYMCVLAIAKRARRTNKLIYISEPYTAQALLCGTFLSRWNGTERSAIVPFRSGF